MRWLGTGLWPLEAGMQVLDALKASFTHIDTAQVYRNEQTVGKALNTTAGGNFSRGEKVWKSPGKGCLRDWLYLI